MAQMVPYDSSKPWYLRDEDEAFQEVVAMYEHLENIQSIRRREMGRWARLYSSYNALGTYPWQYARREGPRQNRVTLNVTKSIVDSVYSIITKATTKATPVTDGGLISEQTKAKNLDRYILGQHYQAKYDDKQKLAYRDACIFGSGLVKIVPDMDNHGLLKTERVFPGEVLVDDGDAMRGSPRMLIHKWMESREVLIARYPDKADAIKKSGLTEGKLYNRAYNATVEVYEAWHLRSGKHANDGRHILCVREAQLEDESWPFDWHPFVHMVWTPPIIGFWGSGIPEEIVGIQYGINYILRQIHESLPWAVPKAMIEAGSNVNPEHLNDVIGGIIRYTGTKPDIGPNRTVAQELFIQLDRLYQRAYEIVGVSQLTAQSKKPADIEAAVALREITDIQTERFVPQAREYERAKLQAADMTIAWGKWMAERWGDHTVMGESRGKAYSVKWSEVAMERDRFILHMLPTSMLPHTVGARKAFVTEMWRDGFIADRDTALRMLNFPDIKPVMELTEAAMDTAHWIVERTVEDGDEIVPEEYFNLEYLVKVATATYNRLVRADDRDEETLDRLRRLIDRAASKIMEASAPPEGPMGQEGLPPGPIPGQEAMGGLPPGLPQGLPPPGPMPQGPMGMAA